MRIAIPVWEEKVSPVLDTARRLLIVEAKEQEEVSRFEIFLDELDIARRCYRIRGLEVDTLICGAVSRPFLRMLMSAGMDIIPEISGPAEEVLAAYLKGDLYHSRFLMPGCKRGRSGSGNGLLPVTNTCRQRRGRKGRGRVKRS